VDHPCAAPAAPLDYTAPRADAAAAPVGAPGALERAPQRGPLQPRPAHLPPDHQETAPALQQQCGHGECQLAWGPFEGSRCHIPLCYRRKLGPRACLPTTLSLRRLHLRCNSNKDIVKLGREVLGEKFFSRCLEVARTWTLRAAAHRQLPTSVLHPRCPSFVSAVSLGLLAVPLRVMTLRNLPLDVPMDLEPELRRMLSPGPRSPHRLRLCW